MQRLFFIYNPYSSNYVRVKDEVLSHVAEFNSYMVGKIAIKKAPFETNVTAIKKILKDGDIVIAVGGDATAAVTVNAILESGKDVTLGVLPYGNFNDLARTLGTMKYEDIYTFLKSGRVTPPEGAPHFGPVGEEAVAGPAQNTADRLKSLYPLDIIVDGKHWRYATCYVTMGMTAEACELFDEPKFRKSMQKGHRSSWRSYLALVKWYFKNRRKKQFIPEFSLNGCPQHRKTSDYAALSGRSMCRVMKGGDDFLKSKTFRSMTDRLTNFWRLFKLMARSILIRTPGYDTTGDLIEFINPSTVELQAEGEYHTFKDVSKIEIRKGLECLKVIMN